MKKLLAVIILSLFWSGNINANGFGDLILSDKVVKNLHSYIKHKKPVIFIVTEDGLDSRGWKCPHTSCVPTGSMNEEKLCEQQTGKKCYRFALRRTIKWKNSQSGELKGKDKRFSSKDSLNEIKTKLTALGFYGDPANLTPKSNKYISIKKKKDVKEKKLNDDVDEDIVFKIKKLNELYKSNVITKEEFKKAKSKLLN